ncbi:hypothetical protein [Lysinibacillus sp. FSL W8-0992]|uniref:hypothetical protein n=1 Tax=Lysinibacillus sp. FSL W8-0992 TaxID=2954643 RepID=UPI0030F53F2F
MTIGEIVEALKCGKALADIGKELSVGKEKLSKALICLIEELVGRLLVDSDGWLVEVLLSSAADASLLNNKKLPANKRPDNKLFSTS